MKSYDGVLENMAEKSDEKRETVQDRIEVAKLYSELLGDPADLDRVLRGRLVAIAFGEGGSAQCRAIEALLGMPAPVVDDGMSDDGLDVLEASAIEYLRFRGYAVEKRPFADGSEVT